MKIAIYGDSFGACPIGVKNYNDYPYVQSSWWELLSEKYEVTNFCEWSASFLFSAEQFTRTHDKFDKVIFLVTHPRRITIKDNNKNRHFVNYEYSTFWKEDAAKQGWNEVLNAVLYYYKYIENNNYSNFQHIAYLDYIKNLRKDVLYIPCFKDSFDNDFCLCDVFDKEQKYWKIDYDVGKLDVRKGHFTNPNHKIMYNILDNYIKYNKFDIDLSMFVNPDLPKRKYII
jgi:hypothetical protein